MGLFDLVLIVSVLLSFAMLILATGIAITGRFRVAGRVFAAWLAYIAIYLAVVLISSLLVPSRLLTIGENACFDDWCIAVTRVQHSAGSAPSPYRVWFRLSSRARRRPQREQNVTVYLVGTNGQRYDARAPDGQPPFDVRLAPGETLESSREFDPPPAVAIDHLVITHQGGFPIGWFIIGQGPFYRGIQLAFRNGS
jgi:hypothetical protein